MRKHVKFIFTEKSSEILNSISKVSFFEGKHDWEKYKTIKNLVEKYLDGQISKNGWFAVPAIGSKSFINLHNSSKKINISLDTMLFLFADRIFYAGILKDYKKFFPNINEEYLQEIDNIKDVYTLDKFKNNQKYKLVF